ncbi:TIR domain-containing protein [Piscinibacter sp.]|uniref:TIR domain-containing protein n=1 Tax=Piscinibacter sp. TaxID=1903157 RepID=UPI002C1F57CA|nr:TIR domain-containing protein [Albitalea sp.]HUG26405.1 TIR domain-containing protein [Albitalea sp.]
MSDIFISYSRRDADFLARLKSSLAQSGRDAWIDLEDIPPSSAWRRDIAEGIEHSHAFVFVLSPDSVASAECAKEIAHAVRNRKRIIPVVCRPVDPQAVPAELAELNWISFVAPAQFDVAFSILLAAVDTDLDWVRAHTRLQLRALQWESAGHEGSLLLRGRELAAAEKLLVETAPGKTPQPTPLQGHFTHESRSAATRLRHRAAGLALVALILVGAASWVAYEQRQRAAAEAVARGAETERANAEKARAELQTKAAVAERQRADEQAKVATLQTELAAKEKSRAELADKQAQEELLRKREQEALKFAADANRILYRVPDQALLLALRGWKASPGGPSEKVVRDAVDSTLAVMRQRRALQIEEAKQWGSGESYIAPTWFSGRLSARLSASGRHALLTTERGESGNDPPGDVYLLDNETLKLVKLDREYKFARTKRRLEYTGFSSSGKRVFVARQFGIEMYTLEGELINAFDCPCTKYPINLIDGIRNDSQIVVADTDGGAFVLAADNTGGYASVVRRGPGAAKERTVTRFLPDPSGRWALLLRGNGTAHLWQVSDRRELAGVVGTRSVEVPATGRLVTAAFAPPPAAGVFATGGEDGTAVVWQVVGSAIPGARVEALVRLHHQASPVAYTTFSDDASELLTVSDDGSVRVWDRRSGKLTRHLPGGP